MKRIYVAGAYSSDNVIGVLENMRQGMRLATEVLLAGFAPFCPWFDFHFQFMLRNNEKLVINDYYQYSLAWLEVSHALLVGDWPECKDSKGTNEEIEKAEKLVIPVYYNLNTLIKYES